MFKCVLIDKKDFKKKVEMNYLVGTYTISIRTRIPSIFAHQSETYFEPAYNRLEFRYVGEYKGYHIYREIE